MKGENITFGRCLDKHQSTHMIWDLARWGGGDSLIRAYWGRAASQDMVFGIFVLNRASILSLCLKQGIFSWQVS